MSSIAHGNTSQICHIDYFKKPLIGHLSGESFLSHPVSVLSEFLEEMKGNRKTETRNFDANIREGGDFVSALIIDTGRINLSCWHFISCNEAIFIDDLPIKKKRKARRENIAYPS